MDNWGSRERQEAVNLIGNRNTSSTKQRNTRDARFIPRGSAEPVVDSGWIQAR